MNLADALDRARRREKNLTVVVRDKRGLLAGANVLVSCGDELFAAATNGQGEAAFAASGICHITAMKGRLRFTDSTINLADREKKTVVLILSNASVVGS